MLKSTPKENSFVDLFNTSLSESYDYARYCGFNNCPSDPLPPASSSPTQASVYTLLGLLVLVCLISMVITILFMDHIEMNEGSSDENTESKRETTAAKFKNELLNLFGLLRYLDIYLLFPLSIFTGFELTFMWNEFNRVSFLFNIY